MSDSSWQAFEPLYHHIPEFLDKNNINRVIENLKKSGVQETDVELSFKSQHDLKKFMQIYEQQISQQAMNYYNQQQSQREENKFRRLNDFNSKEHEVRQLNFPNWRFLSIFIKIYEYKLKQMEAENHYKLQVKGRFLRVYYPKNEKISSFFKNEIFQMKTKLNIYYCNELNVIKKIKQSSHFNKLIQSFRIAAIYNKRGDGIQSAIFYSKDHNKKDIIQIISKNLLEHTTILNLYDINIQKQQNQTIFKLIVAFLLETINIIFREQDIIVEPNYDNCCILVHDRHECHVDAKNQIMQEIGEMMFFKLQGKDMRALFNKVIKNHNSYQYLRLKYSRRALYCVFSHSIFHSNQKNVLSFCQLFKLYFENLNEENKLTYYLKNLNYPNFIQKVSQLIVNSNITIDNFDYKMIEEEKQFSKIVIGVKSLIGMNSVVETRKFFYEVFLKIMLRYDFVDNIVKYMKITPDSFSNILGLSKPSTILPHDTSSMISDDEFKRQIQALNLQSNQERKEEQIETSISEESSGDVDSIKKKQSYEKLKDRKPKNIELEYPFKKPQFYPDLEKFWDLAIRDRKLQKMLGHMHPDPFAKSKFKTYLLALRQGIDLPQSEQVQQGSIFLSTVIQRNNKICYHFIDLNEFKKIEKDSKLKVIFVFYKLLNQQIYIPSQVIEFIS